MSRETPELGLRIADLSRLQAPRIEELFAAIEQGGDTARLVGGTVRNSILDMPVKDYDIATTATPETVSQRCQAAGFKVVPTGIEHGTVTVVVSKQPYEVTTLRRDIETDGRRAKVRFGRDWTEDAKRRDFTMNALYADLDGTIHDPIGGYQDCIARRVRFIENPRDRIREDYLRILRFFRFHAAYGSGELDRDGLRASIELRDGLATLSRERIGQEYARLIVAPGAGGGLAILSETGLAGMILAGVQHHARFARMLRIADRAELSVDLPLRLAVLGGALEEDMRRLTERLKLSNKVRDTMVSVARGWWAIRPDAGDIMAKEALYRQGEETYRRAALFAFAQSAAPEDDPAWHRVVALPDNWKAPKFPVSGQVLTNAGFPAGPSMGETIRTLERIWIESDYCLSRKELIELAIKATSPRAASTTGSS